MRETRATLFPWAKEVPIEKELWREYTFLSSAGIPYRIRITEPAFLVVSDNGHRIGTKDGMAHYVPYGWIHLEWENRDKDKYQFRYQRPDKKA